MSASFAEPEDGTPDAVRVLVLFSTGAIGGAERSLTRMVLAGCDAKVAYRLATVGAPSAWSSWVEEEGHTPTCFGIFGGRLPSLRGILTFLKYCRSVRPHIVYAVGLRAAWIARLYKLASRRRLHVVHAIRSTYPPGSALATAFKRSERIMHRLTSTYIANTQRGAADLMTLVSGIS
jgi:hypothetical protein